MNKRFVITDEIEEAIEEDLRVPVTWYCIMDMEQHNEVCRGKDYRIIDALCGVLNDYVMPGSKWPLLTI